MMGSTLGEIRASMDSLKGKIRSPTEQVESSTNEDAFEDRCLCNVDHEVVRYHDFVNLFMERSEESRSGFEVGHVMVSVLPFFDHSQRKAIRDAGAISGLFVCRISSEPEPVTKPWGCPGEEPSSQAKLSLKDEPQLGTYKSDPELILRAAYWILQSAYFLLRSGFQTKAREVAEAKEVEKEVAKKRVARVSVAF